MVFSSNKGKFQQGKDRVAWAFWGFGERFSRIYESPCK
jgi:hypothetical protein